MSDATNYREIADTVSRLACKAGQGHELSVIDQVIELLALDAAQEEARLRFVASTVVKPPVAKKIAPVGALAAWHRRLASGALGERADASGTWVCDDLWRAACWEASGDNARTVEILATAKRHQEAA